MAFRAVRSITEVVKTQLHLCKSLWVPVSDLLTGLRPLYTQPGGTPQEWENYRDEDYERPTTPWVRSVISGAGLMRNPKYNKGLAFSEAERDRMYLRGLLPPAILSQEVQAERTLMNLRSKASDLDKHTYLTSLQDRNERLFFHVLERNIEELLPIIHTPTVSLYCQTYGLMFRSLPRSLFISLEDRGRVLSILKNWPERRVKAICLTDGERVGSLGDLGVQAVGVPLSQLALYTACGGIQPSMCLPVCIDVGTDNEELLNSPFYVGARHERVRGDAYFELLDEFMTAARRRFGNNIFMHFEGMAHENLGKLMNTYGRSLLCYSDDVQGTAAVVLAGILAAGRLTKCSLDQHTFLIVGEGPATAAIAEMLSTAVAMSKRQDVASTLDARAQMWLLDSKGLVVRNRGDSDTLEDHKLPYLRPGPNCPDLLSAIQAVKPTVLIGISDAAEPIPITEAACREMAALNQRPIIMPLSTPAPGATAEDVYRWTDGRGIYASRAGRTDDAPIPLPGGGDSQPGIVHSAYMFPGLAMGAIMSRATRLREEMLVAAAEALARLVTDEDLARGAIYPRMSGVRDISAHVAKAVAQKAYDAHVATELPKPHDLLGTAYSQMYRPKYRRYR